MKRDYLEELGLEKSVIDKVMAEYGKVVNDSKEEISSLKAKVKDYEDKVKEYETTITDLSSKTEDSQKIQEELDTLKKSIKEEQLRKEQEEKDQILTKNIVEAFGDKKFINDYTKNAIINEIKSQLNEKENAGKSAREVFESITKDKTDIFESDNKQLDMSGMGDSEDSSPKNEVPNIW